MAKKTKDTTASVKKETKVKTKAKTPVDPVKTNDLIRLLNILALLLAVAAFLLQLFAVLSHHWKWQVTSLRPIISPDYHYAQVNVYNDSRLDQNYGLYSRDVKLYANNDEHLNLRTSTRFPRADDGDDALHRCLSQTTTIRGAFLTCSNQVVSPEQCYCRRYVYWNVVIIFEIAALILLGLVVFLTALLTTRYHGILKPAGAGLSLLAFILLLVGLILILTHLKRETRSFADAYPHVYQRFADNLRVVYEPYRSQQRNPSELRRNIRRQTQEFYRAYQLLPGQIPYNETHFQEFSAEANTWIQKPYTSIVIPDRPNPISSQQVQNSYEDTSKPDTTAAPLFNQYGPLLGYNQIFDTTRAGIGWSAILSIIAMVLALLVPLILIFSWLTSKKLGPDVKTVITTYNTEYVAIPQDAPVEVVSPKPIPTDYDSHRSIADAIVTTKNVRQGPHDNYSAGAEPLIVHDVIIRDEQPVVQTTLEQHTVPVNVDSIQTTQQT